MRDRCVQHAQRRRRDTDKMTAFHESSSSGALLGTIVEDENEDDGSVCSGIANTLRILQQEESLSLRQERQSTTTSVRRHTRRGASWRRRIYERRDMRRRVS